MGGTAAHDHGQLDSVVRASVMADEITRSAFTIGGGSWIVHHSEPRSRTPKWKGERLSAGLIDGGTISGLGNGFLFSARSSQPSSFGDLYLLQHFGGSFAKRRTGVEVRNVSDGASVCFAAKDVVMVVL